MCYSTPGVDTSLLSVGIVTVTRVENNMRALVNLLLKQGEGPVK